ncbi:hypothetical protein SDC9_201058 [bioreactor metagenome]|uniref:Large ribosomal RNA subunit accumulation protein YceD n=1 Tax=bioreactor metagenome TaxID=1076179 RepID=A0A645IYP4_9ZZZZ
MIKFSVARLEKEPIELIGDEPAEWLEIEPAELLAVVAPVHYDLLAKAVSGGVLVEGKVRTRLAGSCGRCLEPVDCEIENSGVCLFYEMPEEDEMDIGEDVRAEMLVELPMNLLCSEDCRGLCPNCGVNLNQKTCNCNGGGENSDDRWGALNDLKL